MKKGTKRKPFTKEHRKNLSLAHIGRPPTTEKDYTGFEYNGHRVIRKTKKRTKNRLVVYEVLCPCGKIHLRNTSHIQRERGIKSCDCYHPHNYIDGQSKNLDVILQRKYGIIEEDYYRMFEEQKSCCAICGVHQSKFKKRLAVDHNHETGKVRGLLCNMCNLFLGVYEENPKVFNNFIKYIKEKQ